MTKPLIIGLTGPTGAGKSTVCRVWRELGCAVADADKAARDAVRPGEPAVAALAEHFGSDLLTPDGGINRPVLAARAFASPEATRKLNELTHPHILRLMREQMASLCKSNPRAVVLDAPLLFESGADSLCGVTVSVLAPRELRLKRIMQRDGIQEEAALLRMDAQQEDSFYTNRAGYVLYNCNDEDELAQKAKALLDDLCTPFRRVH